MDLARATCRAPLTARKKGSGYENDLQRWRQPRSQALPSYLNKREEPGNEVALATGDESEFVLKLAQVSSVYRLRSVLICQKSPPSGHLEKSVSPNPDPWDHLIDQIPTLCPTPPPPFGVNIDRGITLFDILSTYLINIPDLVDRINYEKGGK